MSRVPSSNDRSASQPGLEPEATDFTGRLNHWLAVQGGVSFLAGAGMAACFGALTALPSLHGPATIHFLFWFFSASILYAVAALRLERDRLPLAWIWVCALLFRILLLFTSPSLSDDVYRYLWDGHLLVQGVNPYALAVNSPLLDAYTTPLRTLVNHYWMASPYMPAAQLLFALLEQVAPQSILASQLAAVAFDLGTGWLVMDLLRQLGLPLRRVLIYLWNPLVVVEFAHSAHVDAWMIFLIMLSFWLLSRAAQVERRPQMLTLSAVALAGATLTKLVPVLLVPIFLRRWGWRLGVYAAIVVGALALFAAGAGWGLNGPLNGTGVFGALRIYMRQWNYNSGLYHWLEVTLSAYQTPGGVAVEAVGETPIILAKLIATGLVGTAVFTAGLLAWRLDDPQRLDPSARTLGLLRLSTIPLGAYLLFTTTVHPWYVTLLVPILPFFLPGTGETSPIGRFVWPWAYLSCAVALSYLTYLDPLNLREFYWVRQVEYIPLYLLLLWASWPAGITRLQREHPSGF